MNLTEIVRSIIFLLRSCFPVQKFSMVLMVTQLFAYQVSAQEKFLITGTVTDQNNDPLPGVNVILLGTSFGVATDLSGVFNIRVSEQREYMLQASNIGFITQKLRVVVNGNRQSPLRIQLQEDTKSLEQVEIVGKSMSTEIRASPIAVSVIDIEPLQSRNLDLQQALNRVSGVRVREEGGLGSNFNLSINGIGGRGVRYFIDGIPLENFGRSYQVNNLPVSLIERMEVYKGMIPVELGADA